MAAQKLEILETSIEELRSRYNEVCLSNDQIRVKVLAFITGELALVTFLFATGINVPSVIYGIIFFIVGIICCITSFVYLTLTLRGKKWKMPVDRDTLVDGHNKFKTRVQYLENVRDSYVSCIEEAIPVVSERSRIFDKSLMLILVGVIILLVIKYGQGEVLWINIVKS